MYLTVLIASIIDYTHPRKGTETVTQLPTFARNSDYTHPRKGTETRSVCGPTSHAGDYTHPRKGTETFRRYRCTWRRRRDYTHPRKGTETFIIACSAVIS